MNFITKTNISHTCDFGAQMFQYAGLHIIAKQTGHEVVFVQEEIGQKWGLPITEPFCISPKVISYTDIPEDNFFQYDVQFYKNCKIDEVVFYINKENNWNINGDVGSYLYFNDKKDEIYKLFTFLPKIQEFSNLYITKLKEKYPDSIFVSIHFRRGDYLTFSSLNLSLNYYNKAFEVIKNLCPNKNIIPMIFSNGMDWVKQNFQPPNAVYIENLSRYEDMCIMSMCDHNIIANSCFSWWAAYLNKNIEKKVLAPFHYLGDNVDKDLGINGFYYPKDWIALYEK